MLDQKPDEPTRPILGLSVFSFTHHSYGREHETPSEEDFDDGCVQEHDSIKIS
jgi:hypothetical protein